MKRSLFVFGLVALGASVAGAQGRDPQCSTSGTNRYAADACEKAVDLFRYMGPQLGTAIAGGNATLGQGGTLGGIGHFAVGLRGNAVFGSLPKVDDAAVQPDTVRQSDRFATKTQMLPMPVVDAAIGVFKGLPLGVTNVGGIDLLLNAAYIPEYDGNQVQIKAPDGSLKIGYGARIGLLQESILVPGVSFSILKRDLPTLDLTAQPDGNSALSVTGMSVKTTAWRVVASKNLLVFGLAAGVGQDKYDLTGTAQGTVSRTFGGIGTISQTSAPTALDFSMTRTNYFVDGYFNILLLKVVGEIGMAQGGTLETYNTFDKPADKSRLYGSIGFRVGL